MIGGGGSAEVVGGELILTGTRADIFHYANPTTNFDMNDIDTLDIRASVRLVAGPENYVVMFHRTSDGAYGFMIQGQERPLWKWRLETDTEVPNLPSAVIPDEKYSIINATDSNDLRIIIRGNDFDLYINGHSVATATDDEFNAGHVVLSVSIYLLCILNSDTCKYAKTIPYKPITPGKFGEYIELKDRSLLWANFPTTQN